MSLKIVFNPLVDGNFQYIDAGNSVWGTPVADLTTLNAITSDPIWTVRIVESVNSAYVWNGSSWIFCNLVKQANVGSTPNAQGYSLDSANTLTLQPADVTRPGVVPNIGSANGVCPLDGSTKIPLTYLPSVVMEYQGAWNPNTNTPALSDGTGTNGYVYYVTALRAAAVSGLTDPSMVNFQIGDLIIYSTSVGKWQLVTPAAGVQSVNGSQGAVTVNAINQLTGDVTAGPASGSASAASTISVGAVTTSKIAANAVTNSILAQMGANTVKANTTGSTANASDVALGTLTESTSSVLTLTGWSDATIGSPTIQVKQSSTSQSGFLSNTDWNTFNNKQAAGNYITALTGDISASGPGSSSSTLATVNGSPGSFGSASQSLTATVNGKGLVTSLSAQSVQIAESQVTNLVTDLAGKSAINTGDIAETSFSAANNQVAAANVTGLLFASASVGSFEAQVQVYVNATTPLKQVFTIQGSQIGAGGWIISQTSTGDETGFKFTITSAGQIHYTDNNYAGFTAATIKFRAWGISL